MILFVDKLIPNDLGGITTDIKKAEYNLAKFNLSFEKILKGTLETTEFPAGMIICGKYILSFNMKRDLSFVNFGFINSEIEFDRNFNAFADLLPPKLVGQYHKFLEKIKLKSEEELNSVSLSDDEEQFERIYESYIEYLILNHK
jgi:hypothetical protein